MTERTYDSEQITLHKMEGKTSPYQGAARLN